MSPELKIRKSSISSVGELNWDHFFRKKLLQIRRDLVESFSRHILFFSDSNSEIQKISSNGNDKSEKSSISDDLGHRNQGFRRFCVHRNQCAHLLFRVLRSTYQTTHVYEFNLSENQKSNVRLSFSALSSRTWRIRCRICDSSLHNWCTIFTNNKLAKALF